MDTQAPVYLFTAILQESSTGRDIVGVRFRIGSCHDNMVGLIAISEIILHEKKSGNRYDFALRQ